MIQKKFNAVAVLAFVSTAGCASSPDLIGMSGLGVAEPTLKLEDTPVLYAPPQQRLADIEDGDAVLTATSISQAHDASAVQCDAVKAELVLLDEGIGAPAVEIKPDLEPPSISSRIVGYGRDLAVETVLGYIQPVLQTKRAIMNDDEKERRSAEALMRGQIRRAYLIGLADGADCDFSPIVAQPVTFAEAPSDAVIFEE